MFFDVIRKQFRRSMQFCNRISQAVRRAGGIRKAFLKAFRKFRLIILEMFKNGIGRNQRENPSENMTYNPHVKNSFDRNDYTKWVRR